MFGTLGFSELIIILVIVLLIFGAGRLPQLGEGVGKALKGFKKEVQEVPPPVDASAENPAPPPQPLSQEAQSAPAGQSPTGVGAEAPPTSAQPHQPGPEMTPGTTAALAYSGVRPEMPQTPRAQSVGSVSPSPSVSQPVTMEQRAAEPPPQVQGQYPPLPPSARVKPTGKRPSAVVNKEAVARVRAQQAAMKANTEKTAAAPEDLQSLGEGLGSALRTFRQAAADVKGSIDPEMRTIQAELESAQKEVEETIESAKQPSIPQDSQPPSQ